MPGELIEELVEGGERRGILPAQSGDVRSLGQLAVDGYAPADAIELPGDLGIARDEPVGRLRDAPKRARWMQTDPGAEIAVCCRLQCPGNAIEIAPHGAHAHRRLPLGRRQFMALFEGSLARKVGI